MNPTLPRIFRLLLIPLLFLPADPLISRAAEGDEVASKKAPVPAWKLRDEEHWIVDETARTIAELLAFAKDRKAAVEVTAVPHETADQSYKLTARLGASAVSAEIVWKVFIWSPEEHAEWAGQLIAAWKLAPSPAAPGEAALLQTLTGPTPKTIERERRRISAALTKTPLDAGLHVQAALVTAAFAMRESAGDFSDIRRELCRISAHLAIARALATGDAGPARRVAEAALHTLTGRQTPALAALTALDAETAEGVPAWVRALRLRASGDWRPAIEKPTLFEQLEIFRARAGSVDGSFALAFLQGRKPAPTDDWRRVILSVDFGVEQGHQFARESIPQEIASLQDAYTSFFGEKLADAEIVTTLNTQAKRAVAKDAKGRASVSVLGWDFWAAQHQRHLCNSIRKTNVFFSDIWSVPEYRDVQTFVRQQFAALTLFPVLDDELTDDPARTPAIVTRMNRLLTAHPELVCRPLWFSLGIANARGEMQEKVIHPATWLRPAVPFGTVYDLSPGSTFQFPINHIPWESLFAIAPARLEICSWKISKQFGSKPQLEEVETGYAPLRDYHLEALDEIARVQRRASSAKYPETLERICQWRPERYFELGDYHARHGQEELAAEAFQKGVDLSPDRVSVANKCRWLVEYREDHGQYAEALALATMAAETYSSSGLHTMARLQESRGHLEAAEDYLKKIEERYHSSGLLNAFYRRNRGADPIYEIHAASREKQLFPNGFQKVALADLRDEPDVGAVLKTMNEKTTAQGLSMGDVVVAVDGCRVCNRTQYNYLLSATDDPKIRLIIWNPKGYREIEANLPNRQFGVDIGDYKKK